MNIQHPMFTHPWSGPVDDLNRRVAPVYFVLFSSFVRLKRREGGVIFVHHVLVLPCVALPHLTLLGVGFGGEGHVMRCWRRDDICPINGLHTFRTYMVPADVLRLLLKLSSINHCVFRKHYRTVRQVRGDTIGGIWSQTTSRLTAVPFVIVRLAP